MFDIATTKLMFLYIYKWAWCSIRISSMTSSTSCTGTFGKTPEFLFLWIRCSNKIENSLVKWSGCVLFQKDAQCVFTNGKEQHKVNVLLRQQNAWKRRFNVSSGVTLCENFRHEKEVIYLQGCRWIELPAVCITAYVAILACDSSRNSTRVQCTLSVSNFLSPNCWEHDLESKYGGLANTSGPFPMYPNCQIGAHDRHNLVMTRTCHWISGQACATKSGKADSDSDSPRRRSRTMTRAPLKITGVVTRQACHHNQTSRISEVQASLWSPESVHVKGAGLGRASNLTCIQAQSSNGVSFENRLREMEVPEMFPHHAVCICAQSVFQAVLFTGEVTVTSPTS